jgi:hypothetical protein
MVRCIVMVCASMLAAGCLEPAAQNQGDRAKDTLDVQEAVFRFRLPKTPAGMKPEDLRAYLAVDGKDPPAELMKRLQKDFPNLEPVSEEPKEKGLRIYVEGLKFAGNARAEVKAGYSMSTRLAPEGHFANHHLMRDKGRWIVEKVTNETRS